MSFQKILCRIDFSAGSAQAMRVAIRLANGADAELVLAHAWHGVRARSMHERRGEATR